MSYPASGGLYSKWRGSGQWAGVLLKKLSSLLKKTMRVLEEEERWKGGREVLAQLSIERGTLPSESPVW